MNETAAVAAGQGNAIAAALADEAPNAERAGGREYGTRA